jgi:transcriptional regulator
LVEQKSAFQLKKAECDKFADISKKMGTTKDNRAIVTKAGSESTESYLTRISATICGNHNHGKKGTKKVTGGWGGGLSGGFLDQYWKAREKCEKAQKTWSDKVKECKAKVALYNVRIAQCDQFQSIMDAVYGGKLCCF